MCVWPWSDKFPPWGEKFLICEIRVRTPLYRYVKACRLAYANEEKAFGISMRDGNKSCICHGSLYVTSPRLIFLRICLRRRLSSDGFTGSFSFEKKPYPLPLTLVFPKFFYIPSLFISYLLISMSQPPVIERIYLSPTSYP